LSTPVDDVLTAPSVKQAMEIVESSHERSIDHWIDLIEIPAPPFEEDERADAYMQRFRDLGLDNVWKDEEGNVYGERPGTGDGPTLAFLSAWVYPPSRSAGEDGAGTLMPLPKPSMPQTGRAGSSEP
jgi:hypothetical protein